MKFEDLPERCKSCKNIRSWHTKDGTEITYGCDRKTISLYTSEEINECTIYTKN